MFGTSFFTSRSEKETLLKEILKKLSISESERELYILSLEILDHEDFENFYKKITSQFEKRDNSQYTTIEPLTTTLI
jgi:hypothetical protein